MNTAWFVLIPFMYLFAGAVLGYFLAKTMELDGWPLGAQINGFVAMALLWLPLIILTAVQWVIYRIRGK